jgi:hypothetical protein
MDRALDSTRHSRVRLTALSTLHTHGGHAVLECQLSGALYYSSLTCQEPAPEMVSRHFGGIGVVRVRGMDTQD